MKTNNNIQNKKVAALTLGCKVNTYDTQAMLELFINKGYEIVEFSNYADIYLINTCTVTNLGDKKSRQMIRRAKKYNPNALIIAAGCYSQIAPEEVSKVEGVNLVIGTKDRGKLVNIIESYEIEKGVSNKVTNIKDETTFENLEISQIPDKTRAFVKIQEGCNEFCTYCIIPYARGRVRSRDSKHVLKEIQNLVSNGFKEIVIGGIHVASYGEDLKYTNLIKLIKEVHNIEKLKRIRFSSIEPKLITEEFINTIKESNKVCDHFHLSLQSGCNKILKKMNRKYNTDEYRKAVEMLRKALPKVAISTDVIVGFPGEDDNDFLQTLGFVKEIGFSKVHIFPYSAKKGTAAYSFKEQVDNKIKDERSKKMQELDIKLQKKFISQFLNEQLSVLYEKKLENGMYEGYSTNYIKVHTSSDKNIENKILTVKVRDIRENFVISNEI